MAEFKESMQTKVEPLKTRQRWQNTVGNWLWRGVGAGLIVASGWAIWYFATQSSPIATQLKLAADSPLAHKTQILPDTLALDLTNLPAAARMLAPTPNPTVLALGNAGQRSAADIRAMLNQPQTFAPSVPATNLPPDWIAPDTHRPERILIPSIGLDAPIRAVGFAALTDNPDYVQWQVPDEYAVGWHSLSAGLGRVGNTVLNGHNNIYGEVFRYLGDVQKGDLIYILSGASVYTYQVNETHIVPERDQPLSVRATNAEWITEKTDDRVTLVSCWPYTSNTHRVIVVATPLAAAPE